MTIKHITMGLVVVLGFFAAMFTSKYVSAGQSTTQWSNRFTIADPSNFDGGGRAYILHDHKNYGGLPKGMDVCFLVVEGSSGGVNIVPRMC